MVLQRAYGFRATGESGSIGRGDFESEAILRADIAPAAGMTAITRAALFEPGIAGSMQRCSFSFDPTNTTDLTIRFKRRGLSLLSSTGSRYLAGNLGADRPVIAYKNASGVYTMEMWENATSLLAYTWTDDLEEHEWEFRYASTGCTVLLDGVSVASGVTAPTFLDTSFTFLCSNAQGAATGFASDHATYRDFEVIDPATATNKVYLRLDEIAGGPYRNAYLTPGDPLYDATNTSAVTIATTGTDTALPRSVEVNSVEAGAAHVLSGGRAAKMRQAAFGGLGDHATAGQFGLVSWAPTGTPAFNVELDIARSVTQSAGVTVWGSSVAQYADIFIDGAGVVRARCGGTNICTTTVAATPPDGRFRTLRVEFRDSGADVTAAIYVNRKLLVSGTLAATQFSAVAANHYVGGFTGNRRYAGIISRVLLEDLNSATNSARYLMDERTGNYANTYSGGTLASLTRNGYVGCCAVESEDGKGTPWQVGSGAPLVYSGSTLYTAPQAVAASIQIIPATEHLDPTGSFNVATGIFTFPCAGTVRQRFTGVLLCTAVAAPTTLTLGNIIASTPRYITLPIAAVNDRHVLATEFALAGAAGDTAYCSIESVTALDTYDVFGQYTLEFTPTPATG